MNTTTTAITAGVDLPADLKVGTLESSISSGDSATVLQHALRTLDRDGYLVTARGSLEPWNHRVIGYGGVGHDDARFAESGRSMAACYENDDPTGTWWESEWSRRAMFSGLL